MDRVAGVPRARRRDRDRHVPRGVRHARGVLSEGCGNPRGGRAGRPGIPRLPAVALETPAHQERPGADEPRAKAQIARSAGVPLHGLAGAVICEQDEIWQESMYFSEVRMNELYDEGRTHGIDGTVDRARLDAEARKIIESGPELADRIETAQDINRVPGSRTPGRLASNRVLHQLSRHYRSL
jgi:hypothetical protein